MSPTSPSAHWRNSRGALRQAWQVTGRHHTYRVTEERPTYRPRPQRVDPFALVAAGGYLIPAFVTLTLGGPITAAAILAPFAAAIVLLALLRPLGAQLAFIAAGTALVAISPDHPWLFYGVTAVIWGRAVALQSRGNAMP